MHFYIETDPETKETRRYPRRFPQNYAPLINDKILRLINGADVDTLPVWLLGQSEFERKQEGINFIELHRKPELISEITLNAVKRYDYDAAVIFNHVYIIPDALGFSFRWHDDSGPVLAKKLPPEAAKKLNVIGVMERLHYMSVAVNLTRLKLKGGVPLIGYSEGPWTTMCYLMEGCETEEPFQTRKFIYRDEQGVHFVLRLLKGIIIEYLVMQVDAGAQILHLTETNAACLNKELFNKFCLPYLRDIRREVLRKLQEKCFRNIPIIMFAKGANHSLKELHQLGFEVIGLEQTILPSVARKLLGPAAIIQGNLDPCAIITSKYHIKEDLLAMINEFGGNNIIINLGECVYLETSGTAVKAFIDSARSYRLDHSDSVDSSK